MKSSFRTARLTVCLVLAATLGAAVARPASADEHGEGRWRDHDRHEDIWRGNYWRDEYPHEEHRHRDYRRDDWHDAHRRDHYWRDEFRHDEYRHRPDVYYGAPPVVVTPGGYYVQPGATLNFSIPFFR